MSEREPTVQPGEPADTPVAPPVGIDAKVFRGQTGTAQECGER